MFYAYRTPCHSTLWMGFWGCQPSGGLLLSSGSMAPSVGCTFCIIVYAQWARVIHYFHTHMTVSFQSMGFCSKHSDNSVRHGSCRVLVVMASFRTIDNFQIHRSQIVTISLLLCTPFQLTQKTKQDLLGFHFDCLFRVSVNAYNKKAL